MKGYRDIDELLSGLADSSMIDLPTITREEWQAVLDEPVFKPSSEVAAWESLDDVQKQGLVAAGQRSLLARNLLTLPMHGSADLDVDPVLQLALAVRKSPAFVTVAGPRSSGDPIVLAYGVPADRASVLLEFLLIDGLSKLALATPTEAAAQVAAYLVHPEDGDDPTVHKVETFRPGGSSTGRMLVSARSSGSASRTVDQDGRPGELEPTGQVALARTIEAQWAGTAEGAQL